MRNIPIIGTVRSSSNAASLSVDCIIVVTDGCMTDKIEVYIKREEVATGEAVGGKVIGEHGCTVIRGVKTEKMMPEADRETLDIVNQFANDKGLSVEVCNLGTFAGRLKARRKGITKTPTIVIGNSRIEGEYPSEVLRSKLESYLSK